MPTGKHNIPLSVASSEAELSSGAQMRARKVGLRGGRWQSYTPAERLWARTDKTSSPHGCWLVSGWAVHSGHVQINRQAEGLPPIRAHRLAWELLRGPIPAGLNVLHNCPGGDNPRCVNPDHLWLGTQADNIHDSLNKGRYNAFGRQKLNAEQVREIRARAAKGERRTDIAARFSLKPHSVSAIVNRRSWAHLDPRSGNDARNARQLFPFTGERATEVRL